MHLVPAKKIEPEERQDMEGCPLGDPSPHPVVTDFDQMFLISEKYGIIYYQVFMPICYLFAVFLMKTALEPRGMYTFFLGASWVIGAS